MIVVSETSFSGTVRYEVERQDEKYFYVWRLKIDGTRDKRQAAPRRLSRRYYRVESKAQNEQ